MLDWWLGAISLVWFSLNKMFKCTFWFLFFSENQSQYLLHTFWLTCHCLRWRGVVVPRGKGGNATFPLCRLETWGHHNIGRSDSWVLVSIFYFIQVLSFKEDFPLGSSCLHWQMRLSLLQNVLQERFIYGVEAYWPLTQLKEKDIGYYK